MGMDGDDLRFAARAIADADSVVGMTGAGVSTASGVPDFRGDDGLWERHDPMDFHVDRFEADPEGFWTDRLALHESIYGTDDESGSEASEGNNTGSDAAGAGEDAEDGADGSAAIEPNAAHEALAALEADGHLDALITQNVDGLHAAAGSEELIEIHGSGERVVCRSCRSRFPAEPVRERVREGERPPACADCGDPLKPDVVLFGESLPEYALLRAHALAEKADVFLVAGSSLSVEPAASLPHTAADRGATMVVVNLDATPLSGRAEYDFRTDVTDLLPRLREAIAEMAGDDGEP
jgi:NAD-dependent deacetylase